MAHLTLFGLEPNPINEDREEGDEPIDPATNFYWKLGLGLECDVWEIPDSRDTERGSGNWGWSFDYKVEGETFELLKYRSALPDPHAATIEAEEGFRRLVTALTSVWRQP